jgi:hypothetical protein
MYAKGTGVLRSCRTAVEVNTFPMSHREGDIVLNFSVSLILWLLPLFFQLTFAERKNSNVTWIGKRRRRNIPPLLHLGFSSRSEFASDFS